jgi:hypothetical protein
LRPSCAPRVILAQLEGSGRGALGSYNARAYELLSARLLEGGAAAISRDPDAWVAGLLEKDPALGEPRPHCDGGCASDGGTGPRLGGRPAIGGAVPVSWAGVQPSSLAPLSPPRAAVAPATRSSDWERPVLGPPALRVLEVRDAYCLENFEWDQLRRLAAKDTKAANLQLMRKAAAASLSAGAGAPAAGGGGGDSGDASHQGTGGADAGSAP